MHRVRRVSSRTFRLQRNRALGAMRRFALLVKLKPRNFRSCGRATALLASLIVSLTRRHRKPVTLCMTRFPVRSLAT